MSVARTSLTGVTFYSPSEAYNGFTLFSPLGSKDVWLIDVLGKTISHWETSYVPGCQGKLLPDGNLLYAGKIDDGPLVDFEGAGGILLEMDWNGKILWQYKDPYLHHTFYRMKNGNTIVSKWVKVPRKIASKVKGGLPGTERWGTMWGDALQEITPSGEVAWEWLVYEHLNPEVDIICPICSRAEWTHATSLDLLENGDILISFMRTNTVVIVDKKTGDINWRWGTKELSHQNSAAVLNNGNILIFDNGRHCIGEGIGFSRPLEINPGSKKVVWGYEEDPPIYLYSSFLGNCQRLPNGNTLICEGTTGRILEVTPKGSMVWEFVNPYRHYSADWGHNNFIFSAYRYGLEYEGLRKSQGLDRPWKTWEEISKIKPEVAKPSPTEAEIIRSRLEPLGY